MRSGREPGLLEAMHGDPELAGIEQNVELARELGWRWWEETEAPASRGAPRIGCGDERAKRRQTDRLDRERVDRHQARAPRSRRTPRRGDSGRAGRLWGAIEAEVRRVPSESWESERPLYVARLEHVAGPEFDQARAEGARFSLDEAVEYALAGRNEPSALSGEVRP